MRLPAWQPFANIIITNNSINTFAKALSILLPMQFGLAVRSVFECMLKSYSVDLVVPLWPFQRQTRPTAKVKRCIDGTNAPV